MKTRIACMAVLWILIFANTAIAANWVYVGQDTGSKYYIDGETVEKTSNGFTYWSLAVTDGEKILTKKAVWGNSSCRGLEGYFYDSGNKLTRTVAAFPPVSSVSPGSMTEKEIEAASRYVSEGRHSDGQPTLPNF